jgi:hypothetical protein
VTATLFANDQDVVTLTGHAPNVEVVNYSAIEGLWFKVGAEDPGEFLNDDDGVMYCAPLSSTVVAANRPTCVVRLGGDDNDYMVIALTRDGMARSVAHQSVTGTADSNCHPAVAIVFTPPVGMTAIDVQEAINELWTTLRAALGG